MLVLKSSRAQAAVDPLPKHLVEVTFAAHYFLKVYDLIPDNTPEIGLADDYAVLKRVMARNRTELDDIVHSPSPGHEIGDLNESDGAAPPVAREPVVV